MTAEGLFELAALGATASKLEQSARAGQPADGEGGCQVRLPPAQRARAADASTVTPTMQVGIDIGPACELTR